MSDNIRVRRVAELLKHEVLRILTVEINDPRIHDVVITRVKVSKDLGIAWVYYSSYDQDSIMGIEIALGKSGGFIRKKLLESVHMKKVPKLIFERDTVQDEASRLDELFKQI